MQLPVTKQPAAQLPVAEHPAAETRPDC
jgi:hypothetical protein